MSRIQFHIQAIIMLLAGSVTLDLTRCYATGGVLLALGGVGLFISFVDRLE